MKEITLTGYVDRVMSVDELLELVEPWHRNILKRAITTLFDRGWDGKLSDIKYKYNRLRLYLLEYKEEWEIVVGWLEDDAAELDELLELNT